MKAPKLLTNIPGRLFAVGDVHGCVDELLVLLEHLEQVEKLQKQDTIIFLGDFIDRGHSSREVIETLVAFSKRYPNAISLRGNHEEMMLHFLGIGGTQGGHVWFRNGGIETLDSYGITSEEPSEILQLLPPEHVQFLQNLERYVISPQHVFVHAGLSPIKDLLVQDDRDIFWIRDEFLRNIHRFEKIVVFGHTPFKEAMLQLPYKIGIDTGLVYGNKLTAIELTQGVGFSVKSEGTSVIREGLKLS